MRRCVHCSDLMHTRVYVHAKLAMLPPVILHFSVSFSFAHKLPARPPVSSPLWHNRSSSRRALPGASLAVHITLAWHCQSSSQSSSTLCHSLLLTSALVIFFPYILFLSQADLHIVLSVVYPALFHSLSISFSQVFFHFFFYFYSYFFFKFLQFCTPHSLPYFSQLTCMYIHM
ncbi:unnamed protein product [Ceratitis capitata]|uniref:(Mediterranean fruit fly) hypothetical protein n=1 Tax=Ceratitis capitata TaxID=7213 RepID=A0A811VKI1_CERCA|nr:unnamed protein product [Ceratitis capitata]